MALFWELNIMTDPSILSAEAVSTFRKLINWVVVKLFKSTTATRILLSCSNFLVLFTQQLF